MINIKTENRIWWYGRKGYLDKVEAANRWAVFLTVVNIRLNGYGLMWVDPLVVEIYKNFVVMNNINKAGVNVCAINDPIKKMLGGTTKILGTPEKIEW